MPPPSPAVRDRQGGGARTKREHRGRPGRCEHRGRPGRCEHRGRPGRGRGRVSARCRSAPEAPPRAVGPRAARPRRSMTSPAPSTVWRSTCIVFHLSWRRRGHPIERSSWKAITDLAAQHGMASDCVPHQIMDLAAQHGITMPLASAQLGTISGNQRQSEAIRGNQRESESVPCRRLARCRRRRPRARQRGHSRQ